MKLAIVTAIHMRFNLTKAFLKAMSRIKSDFGIDTYASVTHDDQCIQLLEQHNVQHIVCDNKPVGKKFNNAVHLLQGVDFTHLMILGSDDIPSSSFIEYALQQDPKNEYDFIGLDGLWFWGMNPRRAGFQNFGYFPVKGVLAGPGKMVSRRAIEACDYSPWPDECNYGMDAKMMKKVRGALRAKGIHPTWMKYSLLAGPGFLVDVKYEQHISSLSPVLRRDYYIEQDPREVVPFHLPEDESNYLFDLLNTTNEVWEELKKQ